MEHSKEYNERVKKRIRRRRIKLALIAGVLAFAISFGILSCNSLTGNNANSAGGGGSDIGSSQPDNGKADIGDVKDENVIASATVTSVGDILIHDNVLGGALRANGEYDFSGMFPHIKSYLSAADYMVANLEVTLGGTAAGSYKGYPYFNSPDSVITDFTAAGIDMFLTSNNHAYDTGIKGLRRTMQVLNNKKVDYIGTRTDKSRPFYTVKDINGIKVGFVVYTYETATTSAGLKSLNGNVLSAEAGPLVSSFNYGKLDEFYATVQSDYSAMLNAGADAVIAYVHWGNEYQQSPNSYQKQIAKKLADIGVDVIVGGHPHVVQPFETITGSSGKETLCIYSVGNFVSNQRKEILTEDCPTGHTEDGMLFSVTIEKHRDGNIKFAAEILPIWVNLKMINGKRTYEIVPLDTTVSDWTSLGLDSATLKDAKASYNRTMKIIGTGYNAYRKAHSLSEAKISIE